MKEVICEKISTNMSVLLITEETKNTIKMQAVQDAVAKVSPLYGDDFLTKTITLLNLIDVRPLRKEEAVTESKQVIMRLWENCDQAIFKDHTEILIMGIQKGVNLFDDDPTPCLFCIVSIHSSQQQRTYTAESESAQLPSESRKLVVTEKMDIYDAWGKLFGKDVQSKKESLYKHLTGKNEIDWIADTIVKCFDLLKKQ
jgi:hypothetical protein